MQEQATSATAPDGQAPSITELHRAVIETVRIASTEIERLFEPEPEPEREGVGQVPRTLYLLFRYLTDRLRAVSMLVSATMDWDAEIILRTGYETTARILLIAVAEEARGSELVSEFWNGLGSVGDHRRARKAAFASEMFPTEAQASRDIFELLQRPQMLRPPVTSSKRDRKQMEQRWSFAEVIESLRTAAPGGPFDDLRGWLHQYGIASQLIHADPAALDLMADRALRGDRERVLLEAAHAARILSDVATFGFIAADAIRRRVGADFADGVGFNAAYQRVLDSVDPHREAFHESQRDFYDRHLRR